MVFRYCFGITISVSTLMIFSGAATPSSVVNFSIGRYFSVGMDETPLRLCLSRMPIPSKGNFASLGRRLDCLHIVVGQPKMMADLVDQHMADDMADRLVVFGPVIEDRATIEPDHVGQPRDVVMA